MERKDQNKPEDPPEEAFDRIADRYEKYVPWQSRLAREIPFLEEKFRSAKVSRVLDCACGPGRHAVALAGRGFELTGLDTSREMLARARRHAGEELIDVDFVEGRFESLPESFHGRFDGLICLGNSLSAASNLDTVRQIVKELASVLRPGGLAITQTVDFSVVARDSVTASPARHIREGNHELLFVKSFIRVEEQVCIHWLSLENKDGQWASEVSCRPVLSVEPRFLIDVFPESGFSNVETYGDYAGNPFQPGASRDLIIVAHRA
jgi:SAM-dependent methyltransferase